MRVEVMQITFNCQNSIVFNAWLPVTSKAPKCLMRRLQVWITDLLIEFTERFLSANKNSPTYCRSQQNKSKSYLRNDLQNFRPKVKTRTDLCNLDRMLTGQETPFIDASVLKRDTHWLRKFVRSCRTTATSRKTEPSTIGILLHCKQSVNNKGK